MRLGGNYVETLDTLDVVNPFDGEVLSSVCRTTHKEAEITVEKADSSDKPR